jgi:hypothetical protein
MILGKLARRPSSARRAQALFDQVFAGGLDGARADGPALLFIALIIHAMLA